MFQYPWFLEGNITAVEDVEEETGAPPIAEGFEFFSPEGVGTEMYVD